MRFVISLVIASLLLGCEPANKSESYPERHVEGANKVGYWGWLVTSEYEGHKFVLYHYDRGCGLVHHPECKCNQNGKENK